MSDGPHRSLNMTRGWKKLSERADNRAWAPEEIRDALLFALKEDWIAEVPDSISRQVRTILSNNQTSFFGDERLGRLDALVGEIAGSPLGKVFLDFAKQEAAQGGSGDQALKGAVAKTLFDRAVRGARQVEEHYLRESTQNRADHVRERIEAVLTQTDFTPIAGQLVGIDNTRAIQRLARNTGLDDGVQIY